MDLNTAHHEGDVEYCQIAIVKKDQRYLMNGELKRDWVAPLGVFGSQHYYGQTLAWDRYVENNRAKPIDQTTVVHQGNRPEVYIAKGTHATYFCQKSQIVVEAAKLGQFPQYKKFFLGFPDYTGDEEIDNLIWLPIDHGNGVFSNWQGRWGYKQTLPDEDGGMFSHDAPYGPPLRAASHRQRGNVNLLREPVLLHNSCIRNDQMVNEQYKSDLRIGE
jgi:hypothetical protein